MDPASLIVIALIIYFVIKTLRIKKRKDDDTPSLGERHAQAVAKFDNLMEERRNQAEEFAKNWLPGNTLDDYRKAHPDSFAPNGQFKSCHACRGPRVLLRSRHGFQAHICEQCGLDLWHSLSTV